jgi:hypothetical protein
LGLAADFLGAAALARDLVAAAFVLFCVEERATLLAVLPLFPDVFLLDFTLVGISSL